MNQSESSADRPEPGKARPDRGLNRRQLLLNAGALSTGLVALGMLRDINTPPTRLAALKSTAAGDSLPDIQFALDPFIGGGTEVINGVQVRFHPAHQTMVTLKLNRTPTSRDKNTLEYALTTIEDQYDFSTDGIFTIVSYGIPYFDKLPGGMTGTRVSRHMPRLLQDKSRYPLEEAVPAPTDVHPSNPGITKPHLQIPVRIEDNDMLFMFRSDYAENISDVIKWLSGSNTLKGRSIASPDWNGLVTFTSSRVSFTGKGITKQIAVQDDLPFAPYMPQDAPIWSGFTCQQTQNSSGPPEICTFLGNDIARFTTARSGDYFDNAGIVHVSHVILDMMHWYGVNDDGTLDPNGAYYQKVQRMHRSTPPPSTGYDDQYTNGGGTPWLPLAFQGTDDALHNAEGIGTPNGEHRMGHVTALQRRSRANDANATPLHIRMDSPGYDDLDSPDGKKYPKMQFPMFVPTAETFRYIREGQAAMDLKARYGFEQKKNGVEMMQTATRRQNFLCPPRRHRVFPLL